MCLDKHPHENQNTKNLLKYCKYISDNATSSFKQAKFCLVCHYRIFKFSNTIKVSSACLPANRDRSSAYTTEYTAFKFHENKGNFHQHKPLLFRSQYSPCTIVCPLFIHSNRLIFLLKTKVLTFHKGADIQ